MSGLQGVPGWSVTDLGNGLQGGPQEGVVFHCSCTVLCGLRVVLGTVFEWSLSGPRRSWSGLWRSSRVV